ncbi:hypothetical protein GP486_000688 [Trichoglossum hirsutum]|uniref:PSP1 C-terminal domain-containing protein n=1 Tax=Trichoglossum hirsutum TaxID=265104 RepID=A0A9P8RTT4_9PEZI|nr:hypothetical protein GP486_000688 [Trichoglossum hirsutum]
MASEIIPTKQAVKATRSSFGGPQSGNGSIFPDKRGLRGSTPDSEALVSSEDELDQQQMQSQALSAATALPVKPHRRPSWLGDVQSAQRRGSFVGANSFSSGNSHPTTPSADVASWSAGLGSSSTSTLGRGHVPHGSFPWGTGIWNSESRKEPPSRLTEVLASPTSLVPPGPGLYSENEPLASPPLSSEKPGDSTIPFPIPLHPTPKTYRSQSYSVGQLEADFSNSSNNGPGGYFPNRMRSSQPTGLQHRPSRPSMLSEVSNDGSVLGQLHEVDDDDESTTDSQHGVRISSSDPHTYEQHTAETPTSTQATPNQVENPRLRTRSATTVAPSSSLSNKNGTSLPFGSRHQDVVPEEDEYAVDEANESNELQGLASKGNLARRFSEYSAAQDGRFASFGLPENRQLESIKKGQWQSSLGFGGLGEGQQSRRHSFADIPTRNASISSIGEYPSILGGGDFGLGLTGRSEAPAKYVGDSARLTQGDGGEYAHFLKHRVQAEQDLEQEHLRNRTFAVAYFTGPPARAGSNLSTATQPPSLHPRYTVQNQYNHPPSPPAVSQRGMFGMPQHFGLSQPRQNQLLYIVTFKCCRSDVFYIQEGTGLHVKPGDLVIVEADRGTDLGTVAHADVTWAEARDWKEYYGHEHFRWLMVFSRQPGQAGNPGSGMPPNGLQSGMLATQANGPSGSAIGGMGPPQPGHQGMQEPNAGEIRPKMIKRLAQNHEIQTLRDKEGNEAKAKRVCQQKVQEHHLQMEILDAEFQMDWKKLTFYYFADSYINFNSLVTDLFKVYKTRIWMSALNPASYANSSISMQAPSGIGPGALSVTRDVPATHQQQQDQPITSGLGQYRNLQGAFGQPSAMVDSTGRVDGPHRGTGTSAASVEGDAFAYFNRAPRSAVNVPNDYGQNLQQQPDSFLPNYIEPIYNNHSSRFDAYSDTVEQDGNSIRRQAGSSQVGRDGWLMESLQGLSLESQ